MSAQFEMQLYLSRPYLTRQQILCAQKNTIHDRRSYNRKKLLIIKFLTDLTLQLNLPRKTLETAIYYYQRYHLFNLFETELCYTVATSCLVLGCKQAETFKKANEICTLSLRLRKMSNINSEVLDAFKKRIFQIELRILESCGFDYRVNNYVHIDDYIFKFGKTYALDVNICHTAWIIAYDVLKLDLLLTVPQHIIALATLKVACKLLEKPENLCSQYEMGNTDRDLINEAYFSIINFYINAFDLCDLKDNLPSYIPPISIERFMVLKANSGPEEGLTELTESDVGSDRFLEEQRQYSVRERRYVLSTDIMRDEVEALKISGR
ncbi:Ctk2p KNAG_0I01770 [Huiozyma naganishii CBS 8797]|uniref:Cyclin-like domain-containing protein n=1 Tax=Huiozyma naganishii (strain ATCC MYA-139 / BCRC 22969 / CBS 8797 / KCTC 17520 / NBRC 10181 / NCYC 3082 / Yp74L-3) TaxID=1071383 RepID=J7S2E0_HUIN7|nr:hypothetical protein KNAG_0I01770 [Kazachstania naganishii CBS 8797]CCK71962.1 hypothetical protein KNAG_0I01770 [Kazachstania naganishii CBS 8797]